jgi:hypothetical protein
MATLAVPPNHHSEHEKNEKGVNPPTSEHTYDTQDSSESGDTEKGIPEYGSYPDHVFANEDVAEYWRAVYEKSRYEGRHQFDPKLTWTAEEEKRIRRKVCKYAIDLAVSCLSTGLTRRRLIGALSHGHG